MQTTVLSSKGQIIIPKAMRDSRHWHAAGGVRHTRRTVTETGGR
jgi:bifunctional DNA-binding transcriptional regulator/antitoxin component of YhaV-PrlF toxin-antitoxin module